MNVDSILLSDFATVQGGKLTVVGVFNRVPVNEPPAKIPHLSISIVIHGHSAEAGSSHNIEVRLINARREVLTDQLQQAFVFPSADRVVPGIPLRHITIMNILMAEFKELGPYAFEVYIDGTYHASASFYVGPGI